MTYDINAAIAAEVATGPDMTKASAGGGDIAIANEGPTRVRFVGYIEVGKHEKTIKGVKKVQDQVQLIFELSGKNHPPIEKADGTKLAQRLIIKEVKSLNEKANFFKLFTRMNYAGKATHMAQLLGSAFLAEVSHYKFKGADGKDRAIAQLRGKDGYTIVPPRVLDPATEDYVVVQVAPQTIESKVFFWNTPSKAQWDSLFVDGEYEARKDDKGAITSPARSKNVVQNLIKSALNFKGSAVETLLVSNGVSLDLPSSGVGDDDEGDDDGDTIVPPRVLDTTPTGQAATDALNNIV